MLHKQRVFQILIEGLTTGPNYCAVSHFHTDPIGLQSVAGRQSRAWPLAHCHVPDYWGAEIDCGPRSMYTLPRCLITGGRDRCTPCHGAWLLGAEIDVRPATVPDYWGAEIDVHPATVPDYWGARSMYALPRCLITGGPRSMYALPRCLNPGGRDRCTPCHGAWLLGGRDRCTPCHGAWILGAEIDVHPATVPDYWGLRSMYTLPRCLITGGPRSMYALPRCLITGGGGEIDVHPATVPDYWGGRDRLGAEINVHPACTYIYHYVIKHYVRFL